MERRPATPKAVTVAPWRVTINKALKILRERALHRAQVAAAEQVYVHE
jgi:hypothetical protein